MGYIIYTPSNNMRLCIKTLPQLVQQIFSYEKYLYFPNLFNEIVLAFRYICKNKIQCNCIITIYHVILETVWWYK